MQQKNTKITYIGKEFDFNFNVLKLNFKEYQDF